MCNWQSKQQANSISYADGETELLFCLSHDLVTDVQREKKKNYKQNSLSQQKFTSSNPQVIPIFSEQTQMLPYSLPHLHVELLNHGRWSLIVNVLFNLSRSYPWWCHIWLFVKGLCSGTVAQNSCAYMLSFPTFFRILHRTLKHSILKNRKNKVFSALKW